MIAGILAKIFGTKNQRELNRIQPLVHKINLLEEKMQALSDLDLTAKTNEFRERISRGESIDSILPEAFALVRETSNRKLNMRHFDVQLIGGVVLHEGKISEMKTGEGKTLAATLPLYLNALSGKGAHLVTVNDYLARRDSEWMRPIYNHLGLEVGVIQNEMSDEDRKKAYNADITYGTNNEFGFDYLRDNMKFNLADYAQRDLHYAIVDEVDSILIDEARTPLIISGSSEKGADLYAAANYAVLKLKRDTDFEIDEKAKSVHLTEDGNDKVEKVLGIHNLYAPENIFILHHVTQALKANSLFKRDVDYVVKDGQVLIVDEFTGRILAGRRYSDGLHQALEAKENVKIERENQTLASITLQNYFRIYKKLAGMTGTAMTEAAEFYDIYKLAVISIPTHRQMIRRDEADAIYLDREDKFKAVIADIKSCHKLGQPVLVGTIAIETSEYLSYLLTQSGVPHNVLNAKNHAREADIVKEAGDRGKVTIATNMAGRGTDIKLGEGVNALGGLRIIGTERHESRRIDNQLRGRSGRQGDPGSSKFYISLEDDLIRIFAGEKLKQRMMRFGMEKGDCIEHPFISKRIEKAQEKVEKHNYDIRKNLLEYDDVLNQQRKVVYEYRRDILDESDSLQELIKEMILDVLYASIAIFCPRPNIAKESMDELFTSLENLTGISKGEFENLNFKNNNVDAVKTVLSEFLLYQYDQYRGAYPEDVVKDIEKWILLQTIDQQWRLHLQTLDKLKEGIHLRGYAQKNPLVEYKRESFNAFEKMMEQVKGDIVQHIFRLKKTDVEAVNVKEIEQERRRELADIESFHKGQGENPEAKVVRRQADKIGRNDPCPCGSGKKYKQCCSK
ncbi:TPA: preprotein translocase subunit SecA [Candidatus Dependentiae bacterium]|nr:MAG: Protein translocase subunit SecA [candidate division TM6 bacterium GW2011_GWE2_31_21]KKP53232.1 MAG: Protein translocase subunit SecA [candidate division TM6 bacterium GW2011_GWF2_33_332]HBS48069.1 preprotein translocase subunit SecA [Candidatus Dependentiae bacterium]HBZ73328.1 preprotein translocase subunit SecA [Candidatus Dependentiae bacterium]